MINKAIKEEIESSKYPNFLKKALEDEDKVNDKYEDKAIFK